MTVVSHLITSFPHKLVLKPFSKASYSLKGSCSKQIQKMSRSHAHKGTELPLLDEVNELIEKERILLSLKLLEQKQEADEWKLKYDNLVGKVSEKIEETANFESLELAAGIAADSQENLTSFQDVSLLIKRQTTSPWILDLSNVKMDTATFANVCKTMFSTRNANTDVKIALLRNCGLTDENTTALMSVIKNSQILAIDVSHNSLNETFLLQLLTAIKVDVLCFLSPISH